ncbi:hypothetical protein K438DRAFT_1772286 [Mycena galopus ATCC 62051]|nr:hypothetical protein K438DRAFT_1772286 [Mycena galopus ATCC 62051]
MSTNSESSAVMNATGHSSAKSQTKPTTSTPHPLLKSSRGRVLRSDLRPNTKSNSATLEQRLDDYAFSRTRQRTSSVTSVETIRLKPRARVADALLKPKLPLDEATITTRSTRKRTHSSTSPEDGADSGDLPTGPRVRQRRDSNSPSSIADEQLRGILKAKMPTGASSALKKLKEKLTPPPTAEESGTPRRDIRPFPTKSSPSVTHISKTENITAVYPQPATFPSKETAARPRSKTSLDESSKALPFQSLSTNTETTPRRPPIRVPIPGARLNKYGCYELSASEFELAVTFPSSSKSNFEVWDQEDDLFIVGPLSLHLTLKDPAKWDGVPVSHPDVYVMEITCTSKAVVDPTYPYCAASASETNKYRVQYEGAKMRDAVGKEVPVDPKRGITADTLWFRTFADDVSHIGTHAGSHTNTQPGSRTHTGTHDANGNAGANAGRRGWQMQFFVPLATRLFEKRETRAFQVDGVISVWGEELATKVATMNVSHLMWEREMARR